MNARVKPGHDDGEMMPDHFDSLETREPAAREQDLFARLPAQVARAMSAPGWARHLAGIDPKSVTGRAALAKLPLLRKSALPGLQKEMPPFGGFNVTPPGQSKRLFMSPGPIFEPEGHEGDYNSARATWRSTASRITSRPARSFWKPARTR